MRYLWNRAISCPLCCQLIFPNSSSNALRVSIRNRYIRESVLGSSLDSRLPPEYMPSEGIVGWSGVFGWFGDIGVPARTAWVSPSPLGRLVSKEDNEPGRDLFWLPVGVELASRNSEAWETALASFAFRSSSFLSSTAITPINASKVPLKFGARFLIANSLIAPFTKSSISTLASSLEYSATPSKN